MIGRQISKELLLKALRLDRFQKFSNRGRGEVTGGKQGAGEAELRVGWRWDGVCSRGLGFVLGEGAP